MTKDQGPYTGQSMEIPDTPFEPEEIEILGYDADGEPITVDRAAEREEFRQRSGQQSERVDEQVEQEPEAVTASEE